MKFDYALSHHTIFLIVLTVSAIATLAWFDPPPQHGSGSRTTVAICGATINVRFEGDTSAATRADLLTWVRRAGDVVWTYSDEFPVPHLPLLVCVRGGAGVH